MGRLDGKVALITGAGGGMGRVAAELFAAEGAEVAAVDLDEHAEVVDADRRRPAVEAIGVAADVSDGAAVEAAVAATVEAFGGLHVLYNNAGVSLGDDDGAITTPESTWEHDDGRQRQGRLAVLQGRHPGHARLRRRLDHQRGLLRRPPGRRHARSSPTPRRRARCWP